MYMTTKSDTVLNVKIKEKCLFRVDKTTPIAMEHKIAKYIYIIITFKIRRQE